MELITISIEGKSYTAELNDSPTARKISEILPINGSINLWGGEIYFNIPVTAKKEANARTKLDIGELGYWPEGTAFCIFFGPTPVSTDDNPCAYTPVNIIGKIKGDAAPLKMVSNGAKISVTKKVDNG